MIVEEPTEENESDQNSIEEIDNNEIEERILRLTIDIANGIREVLEVKESDDADFIVNKFCIKHNLNDECKNVLINTIKQNLFPNNPECTKNNLKEHLHEIPQGDVIGEWLKSFNKWEKESEQKIINDILQRNKYSNKLKTKRSKATLTYSKIHNSTLIKQHNKFDDNTELNLKNPKVKNPNSHYLLYKKGVKKVPTNLLIHRTIRLTLLMLCVRVSLVSVSEISRDASQRLQ